MFVFDYTIFSYSVEGKSDVNNLYGLSVFGVETINRMHSRQDLLTNAPSALRKAPVQRYSDVLQSVCVSELSLRNNTESRRDSDGTQAG